MRIAGTPHASFTVGSSEMLFDATGSDVVWPKQSTDRVYVLRDPSLVFLSPLRRLRRKPGVGRELDRRDVESVVESAAADQAELGVELVQVPHDARRDDALVAVHLVIEHADGEPARRWA